MGLEIRYMSDISPLTYIHHKSPNQLSSSFSGDGFRPYIACPVVTYK